MRLPLTSAYPEPASARWLRAMGIVSLRCCASRTIATAPADDWSLVQLLPPAPAAVFINVGGGDNVGDLRLADGQSTGFIERHLAHLAQLFQCRAAFNQRRCRAATARPEVIAAGVEMTSAQGQPISSNVKPL